MMNPNTGDFFDCSTRKKFSGKICFHGNGFEEFLRIKDGRNVFALVRDRNKEKIYTMTRYPGKTMIVKQFLSDAEYPKMTKLSSVRGNAFGEMHKKI